MKRVVAVAIAAFLAGAWLALSLVDHVLGGSRPRVELDPFDEPGGGWPR